MLGSSTGGRLALRVLCAAVACWSAAPVFAECLQSTAAADTRCSGLARASVSFGRQVAFGVVPDPARPNDFHDGFGASLPAVCLYRADRIVIRRPRSFSEPLGDSYRVAGDFLAYVIKEDDFPLSRNKVECVNLVTGQYVHEVAAHAARDGFNPAGNIKLRPTGSLAWVEEGPRSFTLRLADRRGVRTPRHGHGMVESSLRLRGSLLRWRQGHRIYSTRLV